MAEQKKLQEQKMAAEEAASKQNDSVKAAAVDESTAHTENTPSDAAVDGDVDAFDDLMIGKTYTDDEDTSTVGTNKNVGDTGDTEVLAVEDGDNVTTTMELEQTGQNENEGKTKRKRAADANVDDSEAPSTKQAKSVDDTSKANAIAQCVGQETAHLDSDSCPTEVPELNVETASQTVADKDLPEASVRSAFHFLDRGNVKLVASSVARSKVSEVARGGAGESSLALRGYITAADLQTFL